MIRGMGANVNPGSIQRAGKAIGTVQHVCEVFEAETCTVTIIPFRALVRTFIKCWKSWKKSVCLCLHQQIISAEWWANGTIFIREPKKEATNKHCQTTSRVVNLYHHHNDSKD